MVGRIEVNNLPTFVTQNDKDIQNPEGRGGDGGRRLGEEVYRYELGYVITRKSTPGLRRRLL